MKKILDLSFSVIARTESEKCYNLISILRRILVCVLQKELEPEQFKEKKKQDINVNKV